MVVEVVDDGAEVLLLWVEVSIGCDASLDLFSCLAFPPEHLLVDRAPWLMH